MVAVAGILCVLLAAVHVVGGGLRFLDVIPRSRWLSAAGGTSVAYVFVHILPDLADSQEVIRTTTRGLLGFVEHHVYLLALAGLMTFYGLERLAKLSRSPSAGAVRDDDNSGGGGGGDDVTARGVFWVHVGSFAAYNALIGYLFLRGERSDTRSLLLFFAAMATHFLVNDHGLRQHHKRRYDRYGRWLLAAAVLLGWATGAAFEVHRAVGPVIFAFLSGGIVLNVLKEELPEERRSNFAAFAAGAVAYSTLLLAM